MFRHAVDYCKCPVAKLCTAAEGATVEVDQRPSADPNAAATDAAAAAAASQMAAWTYGMPQAAAEAAAAYWKGWAAPQATGTDASAAVSDGCRNGGFGRGGALVRLFGCSGFRGALCSGSTGRRRGTGSNDGA